MFRTSLHCTLPLLLTSAWLGTFARPLPAEPAAPSPRPPNVVLIISDDQAYTDFGFMGNRMVRTPHLDRLAAQSARFTHGYVPTSVCRPSLATLLTGLYPHQHGIHFNHPPHPRHPERHEADYLIRAVPTLPRLLGQAGYRSFQTGKYWEGHYRNAGFDEGMTLGEPAPIEKDFGLRPAHGNGDAGLSIGRRTMGPIFDFLDRCGDRPFFLWYAPFLPHTPHNVSEEDLALYRGRPDVPPHYERYYASITRFDRTVGELLDYLDRKGHSPNTLFVFLVDNGWMPDQSRPTRHDARTKWSPYEMGVRTPVLLRWDGRIRPATHDGLVSSVDLAPTILAAAGRIDEAASLPGVSLLPVAEGHKPLAARPAFGEIYANNARKLGQPAREVKYRWVRSGRFKLIVPSESPDEATLFDVVADPKEQTDLSGDPRHAPTRAELLRMLDGWWSIDQE